MKSKDLKLTQLLLLPLLLLLRLLELLHWFLTLLLQWFNFKVSTVAQELHKATSR